jgi:hypothetical protein
VAPELDELVVADVPESWVDAGFTVDTDGTCRVGSVRIRIAGPDAGKRIVRWSLRGLPDDFGTDLDGLPTEATERDACAPADHANGATAIDHVVAVTPDVDRTVAAAAKAGIEVRRTRRVGTEQYGFDGIQTFFRLGEPIFELLGPLEPAGAGPAGWFGLAYTVSNLDALADRYGPALGRIKDAVQPGRRIATLRHKELGLSVPTAFMTPERSAPP